AVACINMSTALLTLIVERNNMLGILKALGARNSSVRNLFLYMASYLMIGGMLIGNIIGIGLCWSEQKFAWLKLPQEAYYLSEVPVKFETTDILFINIGAFIICLLVLIIPSRFVLRISPAKQTVIHYGQKLMVTFQLKDVLSNKLLTEDMYLLDFIHIQVITIKIYI
ncbi:MAG: FtsX-like permease family protein, partial [Bacteroidota bacterium]